MLTVFSRKAMVARKECKMCWVFSFEHDLVSYFAARVTDVFLVWNKYTFWTLITWKTWYLDGLNQKLSENVPNLIKKFAISYTHFKTKNHVVNRVDSTQETTKMKTSRKRHHLTSLCGTNSFSLYSGRVRQRDHDPMLSLVQLFAQSPCTTCR